MHVQAITHARTHTHARAQTHACCHARTHERARTHAVKMARTHACTHTAEVLCQALNGLRVVGDGGLCFHAIDDALFRQMVEFLCGKGVKEREK